ncbi:serine/arginine-rich splicing factor RS2Z33-like [Acropora millepora]|uniref:serine/arginine-rich splicing factor RS2Z33-like n=1 Tax=Acropora millepora TaxID=45264 RepID=UPI001CF50C9F|nr:serine/arginine-rich splicing factor RS2Z33-like [Acropora millepora]
MARRFKRTVVLDLSRFSSDLPRYDVAKMVYKRFEGSASVQSIQFVPGKNVQITFKDSKNKESIEKHEYITINDVRCAVVGGGPRVQNVLIHHYPFEEDNHRLWIALSSFGEVRDIQYQHYPDLCSISTGTRVVKMVRNSPIPRSLDVGGYMCKTWYVGQPVECDICQGGHVSKNCPLKGKCRRCLESGHMARDCKNPPKSWSAGVSSGGIAVAASGTAGGAAAGVLDPTPAEASGRGPSSELQPSGSYVSRSRASVMDMRDNELSPPSFGEGLVADDTIRNLSNESNDDISNTVVIDEGEVVTVESSVNNTVDGNKNNSGKNSNNSNKNSNVNQDIFSNTELSNEQSQSQDSSSSDLSQSVLLGDAEMIEASGVRKRGISSVDVSSDGAPTRVPASRNGAKKRVSDRASSQEPRRAVHANLPSAASSIPLRKRS